MTAQRSEALARLRALLCVPLRRVVSRKLVTPFGFQRGCTVYQFDLILDSGEVIRVARATTLFSQQRTRVLVFGRTLHLIPRHSRAAWDEVLQLLLDVCEEEQPPECEVNGNMDGNAAAYAARRGTP